MTAIHYTHWDGEMEARLRKMHAEGIPYDAIARALHVTESAVAGKVQRLALDHRKPGPKPGGRQVRKWRSERFGIPQEVPILGRFKGSPR